MHYNQQKWTACAAILQSIVYYAPKNTARSQLYLASTHLSMQNLRSALI